MILTVVLDFFASKRQFDDLHGFFQPRERRLERPAMQTYDDLRTARTEAQDEAVVADRSHRQGGHHSLRRHARADLHDAGAEPDSFCARGEIGERRNRVLTPCLGGPDRIHAELFRFDDVVDLFVEVALTPLGRAADPDADSHVTPMRADHCRVWLTRMRRTG